MGEDPSAMIVGVEVGELGTAGIGVEGGEVSPTSSSPGEDSKKTPRRDALLRSSSVAGKHIDPFGAVKPLEKQVRWGCNGGQIAECHTYHRPEAAMRRKQSHQKMARWCV